MASAPCEQCSDLIASLSRAEQRIAELVRDAAILREQLKEALKLGDLRGAEIERWRELVSRFQENRPERVASNELQLAFEAVLLSFAEPAANANATDAANTEVAQPAATNSNEPEKPNRDKHGRRDLSKTRLPVKEIVVDPPEVLADGGEGWELISAESSERVGREHGGVFRIRVLLRTWVRKPSPSDVVVGGASDAGVDAAASLIVTAPLPESLWPGTMGDPSAIANIIVSKYDDSLPLHRQEKITARNGFKIARSTQCNWLEAGYGYVYRVVDAMMADGLARSHVIATDATGAPVRAAGKCDNWHVFVFIMERDHVVFRHSPEHTGDAVRTMMPGFRGNLLADAHIIYEQLYREQGVVEAGDWAHVRRYFWKSIPADRTRSLQGIALIGELFAIEEQTREMQPHDRLLIRRQRSSPVLDLFDRWVERERSRVDARSPLDQAFGYYTNQRNALRRFLDDGRLPIHNNASEAALRNLVLGRANWMWFENETGLRWYCAFRSLIASCALHGLNAEIYIEQLLRLAPHWPTTRMIELSPKYWLRTIKNLDERGRTIITPPWQVAPSIIAVSGRRIRPAA